MGKKASGKRTLPFVPVILILLSLSAAAGGFFYYTASRKRNQTLMMTEQRLRSLRRLNTIRQTYRSIIYVSKKGFLQSRQILFSVEYNVIGGVDFTRDFSVKAAGMNGVKITMPGAEIFSSDADEGTIHQMFLQRGLFNPIKMSDYTPLIAAQGNENRRKALKSGILAQADINARTAITEIFRAAGIRTLRFEN